MKALLIRLERYSLLNGTFLTMLIYRQKTLLSLLQALGGLVPATDFQKYLFLFTRKCQKEKSYDFVPYKYGCYSFQATADKGNLINKGYLANETAWELMDNGKNYSVGLNKGDAEKITLFVERYKAVRGKKLIQQVYREYPYFAINSQIAEEHLDASELEIVNNAKPKKLRKASLTTIGYEGGSIELYINKLLEADIRLLVDVRKNPISRKYGFSKKTLSSLLSRMGIEYVHIPELGIKSVDRKNLNNQSDYDRLFASYEKTVLVEQAEAINALLEIYEKHKRIALTCFEKDHKQCHRSLLANKLNEISPEEIELTHL